jgi:hypothetical protein
MSKNKPGRLFPIKIYDKIYNVPKYIYDSYNLYTYYNNQIELDKIKQEIIKNYESNKIN